MGQLWHHTKDKLSHLPGALGGHLLHLLATAPRQFYCGKNSNEPLKTQLHQQSINNDVNGGVCSQSPEVPDVEPAVGSTGGQDGLVVGGPLDL